MDNLFTGFKKGTDCLNENKYFIGVMMILVNLGARFIIDELGDDIRSLISDKIIRKIFIFCAVFMATRDVLTSFILTVVFVIIINEFFGKEESVKENPENGSSYNKTELEKTIQQLKNLQNNI
tara:strand:- start:227 stop:595 length:369 start_codon:yes stop_codon:yes gene_type:complete